MKAQIYSNRRLWLYFLAYSFGNLLIYSAFGSLLGLQSSLNVVDSIGTKTSALLFGSSVVCCVTVLPILLRRISPRKLLIASGFCYAIYTLANFYPKNYTLIPAAICVGVGDAILWSNMPIFFSFFATEYEKITKSGEKDIAKFSGYFFGMFQLSKIIGNSINYSVLHAFCTGDGCHNSSNVVVRNITHCGASDCQDPQDIRQTLSSYVPSRISTYIILSTMLVMYFTAILLFALCLPRMRSSRAGTKNDDSKRETCSRKTHIEVAFVLTSLKDTFRQIFSLKQLLLMPGIFYGGFDFGFLTSELTRAYTSCVFGVSQVAIHLMIFGVSACAFSALCGKLSKFLPTLAFIFFAAVVDATTYTYYLLWIPNATTQWAVIPAYMLAGGMQGIWKPQSLAIQARTFSKTLDVGSAVWLFWWTMGICTQFAISPLFCVREKIIVHLTLLGISTAGYVAVELIERNTTTEINRLSFEIKEESSDTSTQDTSPPTSNLL